MPPDSVQAAKSACIRLLARREHSRYELRQKLAAKGYPHPAIDLAIDELSRDGLQSDSRFTESYVRSRLQKGYGINRIRQELSQRGIKEIPRDAYQPDDLGDRTEIIEKVYTKKYGGRLPKSREELASRARFMQRRGFTLEQIHALFKRLRQADEPEQDNLL